LTFHIKSLGCYKVIDKKEATMKKILIFASGSKDGGGSGFQELVENSRTGVLSAEIVAVVSNHENGGVRKRADKLAVPFIHFSGEYKEIVDRFKPDLVCLSGWLKLVKGLDSAKTINIHPGSLPEFGGAGMYGHHVHEAVINSGVKETAVSMHFVTEEYDEGPVFFRYPIAVRKNDTADTLAGRVNKIEHSWQSYITNLVVQGEISWDGKDPNSLVVPEGYKFI